MNDESRFNSIRNGIVILYVYNPYFRRQNISYIKKYCNQLKYDSNEKNDSNYDYPKQ